MLRKYVMQVPKILLYRKYILIYYNVNNVNGQLRYLNGQILSACSIHNRYAKVYGTRNLILTYSHHTKVVKMYVCSPRSINISYGAYSDGVLVECGYAATAARAPSPSAARRSMTRPATRPPAPTPTTPILAYY